MALPVKIEFLNMAPSESAVSCVHEEAASLEQLYDRIWACHVEIKARSRRRNVRRYEMRVALVVPDTDLVVSRGDTHPAAEGELDRVIREGFGALQRQLELYIRSRCRHPVMP